MSESKPEPQLRRDYLNRLLCLACFNNMHYGYKRTVSGERTSVKVSRCLQNGCECMCVALLEEQDAKRKAKTMNLKEECTQCGHSRLEHSGVKHLGSCTQRDGCIRFQRQEWQQKADNAIADFDKAKGP